MNVSGRFAVTTMRVRTADHRAGNRAFLDFEVRSGGVAEVVDVVVDDRRKGIGRALVEEMVRQLPTDVKTVYAFTRASNLGARSFWRACGFKETCVLENFYGDGGYDMERAGVFLIRGLR